MSLIQAVILTLCIINKQLVDKRSPMKETVGTQFLLIPVLRKARPKKPQQNRALCLVLRFGAIYFVVFPRSGNSPVTLAF
jgi:hypothetical protein